MKKMERTGEKIKFVVETLKGFFPKGCFKFSEAKLVKALDNAEEVYNELPSSPRYVLGCTMEIHERMSATAHMIEIKGIKLKNMGRLWKYLESLLLFTKKLEVVEGLRAHGYGPDITKRAFGTIEYVLGALKSAEKSEVFSKKLEKLKNKVKQLRNKNPFFLLEMASEVIEMSTLGIEEKKLKEKAVNACRISARLNYLTSTIYKDLYLQQYDSMSARIESPFIPNFIEMAFKKVCAHPHHEKAKLELKKGKYVCPICKVKVGKRLLEEIKRGYMKIRKTGNISSLLEAEFEPRMKRLEKKKLSKDEFEKKKKEIIDKLMKIHEESWREVKEDIEKIKKQIKDEGFSIYAGEEKSKTRKNEEGKK